MPSDKIDDSVAAIRPHDPELILFWPEVPSRPHGSDRKHMFKTRRYLNSDGSLAELWLYRCEYGVAVDVRDVSLLDSGSRKHFLLRHDANIPPDIAEQLLRAEHALASTVVEAALKHFGSHRDEQIAPEASS
jgi:hypothetical protein